MADFDLLSVVQPSDGWFAVLGIKGKSVLQELVATRPEVDALAKKFVSDNRNVYFGVAKFASNENRRKDNVLGLKAFWLDIDCGPTKAVVNPKTNRPDGYIDQLTALAKLREFCKTTKLPRPVLVDSGFGIHAYWPMDRVLSRGEWEPVAAHLLKLCQQHDLYVDPVVFEPARILRLPGTLNYKDNPPAMVTLLSHAPAVEFDTFCRILDIVKPQPIVAAPKRELTALGKLMANSVTSNFAKIMVRSAKGNGCPQLLNAFENRTTLPEPRWFDALSIAKFCEDQERAIHKLSEGHEAYSPAKTQQKIQHIVGPHTCEKFERNNPGGCDGCAHKGKIKSPIVLGKVLSEAKDEEGDETNGAASPPLNGVIHYPKPFARGKNGGIFFVPPEADQDPIFVYEHDLYVVRRMNDPVVGDVAVLKLHTPHDGIREFVVPNATIMERSELRKTLASFGVICGQKKFELLSELICSWIRELQHKEKADQMRLQFGWADNDSKFIVGDKEFSPAGIFHSPPSSVTAGIADHIHARGSLEKWKEVFNLYGRPGLELHAFAALTAFGSPLLKFLGQNGAIINVIHQSSGTGKTTILHMCNSVYGHPSRLCGTNNDTLNAKIMRLGIMNNLPFTIDEITNMTPKDFSELAYSMSQGRGKDRVKSSANELRVNRTSWQCISLCSSNASFHDKMNLLKANPDGELMRLLEYRIGHTNAIPTDVAKQMFDHQLQENFGLAGDIYISWLVSNLEEASDTALSIQAKIDRELQLTQRERFWSAVLAANITGGLIAKQLQLINWDMKTIYKAVTEMVINLRGEVKSPVDSALNALGDYINRHMQNVLVVNAAADKRSHMPMLPLMEPRGELLIRYEPDAQKLYFTAREFKKDCAERQIDYRSILQELKDKNIFIESGTKRLSKGMKVQSPGVHTLTFNCHNTDFFDLEELTPPEDASHGTGESNV